MADQPVGYWRLGDTSGTGAADETASARHGTRNGGVARGNESPEPIFRMSALATEGYPMDFNGVDGYVSIPTGIVMGSKYTHEFWIYPYYYVADTSRHGIMGNATSITDAAATPSTWVQGSDRLTHGFGNGTTFYGFDTQPCLHRFHWHHVAITFDFTQNPCHRVIAWGRSRWCTIGV